MKTTKLILAGLSSAILAVGIMTVMPVQTKPQPTSAQQSAPICQYPDRWTNPPGGCDNSDPAVPECIKDFSTKAGEDACIAAFVAAHQTGTAEKQQAIAEHDAAFNTAQPQAAQCGGK